MNTPLTHPEVEAVQAIHPEVLAPHDGATGIGGAALLESPIAAPQASMMGRPIFSDPIAIATAYPFCLCCNRPFLNGNKRTTLATCLACLSENDRLPDESLATDASESLTLDVAAIQLDRDKTTVRLRSLLGA